MHKKTVVLLIAIGLVAQPSAQQMAVPFAVCVQSDTWTRPSPDVQSTIWSDSRYREPGATSYQWTHNFLSNEPDSASITYHNQNLSGIWTEIRPSQCQRRDEERGAWSEIWALNYHVALMTLDGRAYTVRVEPRKYGYEIIQFRRPDSLGPAHATLRFVSKGGRILDEWIETSPSVFVPVLATR